MKKKMKMKMVAILTLVCFMFTLTPMAAMAEDEITEVEVGTEEALKGALEDVSGNKIIVVTNNITLENGIAITGSGNVTIQGKTGKEMISAAANADFSSNAHGSKGSNIFLIVGDEDIAVTLQKITIDGNKDNNVTARLFQIGGGTASSYQLTLGEGAILKNAYTTQSGGGVFVRGNATLMINGGEIQNCKADSYGGGVQVSGENATLLMNSGNITGNSGKYAGGICYYGGTNSKVELYGGTITGNVVVSESVVRPGGLFVNGAGMYIGGNIQIVNNSYEITNNSSKGSSDVWTNSGNLLHIAKAFSGEMTLLVRKAEHNTVGVDLPHVLGTDSYSLQTSDLQGFKFSDISNEEYMLYLDMSNNQAVCKVSNTIMFNANDGTSEPETTKQQVPSNIESVMIANTFFRAGYTFTGWSIVASGEVVYADKAAVAFSEDTTLYAQWAERQFTGIEVTTEPAKTAYYAGELFDPTGMVISKVYDNGEKEVVTDYTLPPSNALSLSDNKITITYDGKTVDLPITVTEKPVAPIIPPTAGSSGGGFTGVYNYPVVAPEADGADVTLSDDNAVAGETVTITVTPDEGKQVGTVIVTDADGDVIPVTKVGANEYTFTMPEGKVNITVTTKTADYDTKLVLKIDSPYVTVNGTTVKNDVAPIVNAEGRTMLPIRVIAEALGADVDWNPELQRVTITKDGTVIELFIGKYFAYVNDEIVKLDTAAFIDSSRTYLQVRFISELLGCDVDWDAITRTVTIQGNK